MAKTLEQAGMAHTVRRIHSPHRHRRPARSSLPPVGAVPCDPTPVVVHDSGLPHAAWIIGGWLLAMIAGVMLGIAAVRLLG